MLFLKAERAHNILNYRWIQIPWAWWWNILDRIMTDWTQGQRGHRALWSPCSWACLFQQLWGQWGFLQTLLAKGTSEGKPGTPSPTSTHGGSKGLALEGLGTSAGQHCPQTRTCVPFWRKKFSDSLHKRSWSKDVLFRDVTLKNGIPAMSPHSRAHSAVGPAAFSPVYSLTVLGC